MNQLEGLHIGYHWESYVGTPPHPERFDSQNWNQPQRWTRIPYFEEDRRVGGPAFLGNRNAQIKQYFFYNNQRHHEIKAREQAHHNQEVAGKWRPILTKPGTHRVDIYGGTVEAWNVITLHSSRLNSLLNQGVQMLDLVDSKLGELLEPSARCMELPRDLKKNDPFLESRQPTDLAMAMLSAIEGVGEPERNFMRRLIKALGGEVSLSRVKGGLETVLGVESLELSQEEINSLRSPVFHALVGEGVNQYAAMILGVVDSLLEESGDAQSGNEFVEPVSSPVQCKTVNRSHPLSVRRAVSNLVCKALADRILADRVQRGTTVFLLGADLLGADTLKLLTESARDKVVKLIVFFEGLREETQNEIGRHGEETIFMRLGNRQDAEAAANFIGREHVFTMNSETRSEGSELSSSSSWSKQFNHDRKKRVGQGDSTTSSQGTSYGKTQTSGKSEEFYARPEDIQNMPASAFLYTASEHSQRFMAIGDCHPAIESAPNFVREATQLSVFSIPERHSGVENSPTRNERAEAGPPKYRQLYDIVWDDTHIFTPAWTAPIDECEFVIRGVNRRYRQVDQETQAISKLGHIISRTPSHWYIFAQVTLVNKQKTHSVELVNPISENFWRQNGIERSQEHKILDGPTVLRFTARSRLDDWEATARNEGRPML